MDEKASGRIKAFLGFLREAKEGYNIAFARVGDADREIQDILHWTEFNAEASEEDRVKVSKAETRVRQERRRAKNEAGHTGAGGEMGDRERRRREKLGTPAGRGEEGGEERGEQALHRQDAHYCADA